MSTEGGQPPKDLVKLEQSSAPTKLDDTAAILERFLQHEIDQRKEERFYWIFICVILGNIIAFPMLGLAAIPILLLELVFLIAIANWLGVDAVAVYLERIFDKYLKRPGD